MLTPKQRLGNRCLLESRQFNARKKMKNFLLKGHYSLLCGLVVVASCNESQNILQSYSTDDNEIRFGSNGIRVETKSFVETDNDVLVKNGFRAMIVVDDYSSVMVDDDVEYNDAEDVFYFVDDQHYYYPAESTVSIYGVYPGSYGFTKKGSEVSVEYSTDCKVDLTVAKAFNVTKRATPVQLEFNHILSQVTVAAKTDNKNIDCYLYGIEIITREGGIYYFDDGGWDINDYEPLTVCFYEDEKKLSTNLSDIGGAMSFIPGTVSLKVYWSCWNKDGCLISDNAQTVSVNLPKGKHTTLNLTLSSSNASEILIETSVQPWATDEQNIELVDATYSVNATASQTVTIPTLNMAVNTRGIIDWGDGKTESFASETTKSALVSDNELTLSHTYSSAFTGKAKITVSEGKLTGDFEPSQYSNFQIYNAEKVQLEKLSKVFTVNEDGDKVRFSLGNLYWDGTDFKFEEHQYDFASTWNRNHISHFYWSKSASIAMAKSYNDSGRTKTDNFFAADNGTIEGYTVLSRDEWQYIIDHSLCTEECENIKFWFNIDDDGKSIYFNGTEEEARAFYAEKNPDKDFETLFGVIKNNSHKTYFRKIENIVCAILKPDDFNGEIKETYTIKEWDQAEKDYGLVALPTAGNRGDNKISGIGYGGYYYTSSVNIDNYVDWAYVAGLLQSQQNPPSYTGMISRQTACSIRLVKPVE